MLEKATIVVGTDLTEFSQAAVEAACGIATRFGARKLVIAHGVKAGGPLAALSDATRRAFEKAKQSIEEVQIPCDADFEVERVVRTGPPARVVVEAAEERGAELIVVSSHGFGAIRRAVVGSVANAVVRASEVPVLVVGADRVGDGPVTSVTAAIDLSPVSDKVMRSAVTFGCSFRAPVRMVSVFEGAALLVSDAGDTSTGYPPEQIEAARRAHRDGLQRFAEMGAEIDVPVETVVLEGASPPEAILHDVREHPPSLLVIGTSGHDGWHRLVLGATADQVMCEASVPVLVVPVDAPALEGCRSVDG